MDRRNYYEMDHTRSYYTYGSAARELQPLYLPDRTKEEKRKKEEERRLAEERKVKRLELRRIIVCIVLLFVGCGAFVASKIIVENKARAIRLAQDELSTLQNANLILEAELTEQVDLEYIKQEAMSRLGMAEPQSYQIVYIDVPEESYTVQYDAPEEETSGFSIMSLLAKIF